MDQTQVDQHLTGGSHGQVRKDRTHQTVPINNRVGVIALGTVGRRCKTQRSLFRLHQGGDHSRVTGITTDQAVRAEQPDITSSRYRIDRCFWNIITFFRCVVGIGIARLLVVVLTIDVLGHHGFDLSVLKAGEYQVVTGLTQLSEFKGQHLFVPPGIE